MKRLTILPTPLHGAFVVNTAPFEDSRGSFSRFFCSAELSDLLEGKEIRAVNCSLTKERGTIRGLHFQTPPFDEIRMVRCLQGKVFDVMVDLRKDSPTYCQWHGEILTFENNRMMFIPEGFAHGFQTLEPNTELLYFHTKGYSKECDSGVQFNDPAIGVAWPLEPVGMSERDLYLPPVDRLNKGAIV